MTLIKKKYIREKGLLLGKGLIKGIFTPSKTDATFYWTGEYDGTSLVNVVGVNVPLVSGTGLDAIYDFSGLNDDRFDKSNTTYWGLTLDDYFYYDAANPYYSKLKDFHYYYTEAQFTGLDSYNTIFLKAKATTNTSNEIESVSGLVVYSTSLEDSKLSKTKSWTNLNLGSTPVEYHYLFPAESNLNLGVVAYDDLLQTPNLLSNHSFETYTGTKDDPSANNSFTDWDRFNLDTSLPNILAITGVHGVTQVQLLTSLTPKAGGIRRSVDVEANTEYIFRFKHQNVEYGRYSIYDNSNEAYIIETTNVDPNTENYGTVTEDFKTPSGCTSIKITFTAPSSLGNYFNVDEVVLSKPYNLSVSFFVKRNVTDVDINRDYIISRLWSDNDVWNQQRCWSIRFKGDESDIADMGKLRFSTSKDGDSTTKGVDSDVIFDITDTWYHVICTQNYVGSGKSDYKMVVKNLTTGIISTTAEVGQASYAFNGTAPLTFANLEEPTAQHPAACELAKIQIKIGGDIFTDEEILTAQSGGTITNLTALYNRDGIDSGVWNDSINELNAVITEANPIIYYK